MLTLKQGSVDQRFAATAARRPVTTGSARPPVQTSQAHLQKPALGQPHLLLQEAAQLGQLLRSGGRPRAEGRMGDGSREGKGQAAGRARWRVCATAHLPSPVLLHQFAAAPCGAGPGRRCQRAAPAPCCHPAAPPAPPPSHGSAGPGWQMRETLRAASRLARGEGGERGKLEASAGGGREAGRNSWCSVAAARRLQVRRRRHCRPGMCPRLQQLWTIAPPGQAQTHLNPPASVPRAYSMPQAGQRYEWKWCCPTSKYSCVSWRGLEDGPAAATPAAAGGGAPSAAAGEGLAVAEGPLPPAAWGAAAGGGAAAAAAAGSAAALPPLGLQRLE